jgi:hypothetical protein
LLPLWLLTDEVGVNRCPLRSSTQFAFDTVHDFLAKGRFLSVYWIGYRLYRHAATAKSSNHPVRERATVKGIRDEQVTPNGIFVHLLVLASYLWSFPMQVGWLQDSSHLPLSKPIELSLTHNTQLDQSRRKGHQVPLASCGVDQLASPDIQRPVSLE